MVNEATDKRSVIMAAAIKTFAQKGYHGTRVSDIAKEAGVAYGLVYHYFENKEQLLNSIFHDNWQVFLRALQQICLLEKHPFQERVQNLVGFLLDTYEHNPELLKVLIVEVTRSNRFQETGSLQMFREAFDTVAKMIRRAQKSGEARKDIDARLSAFVLLGCIDTVLSAMVVGVSTFGHKDTEQLKLAIANYALGGLTARP
ncbi:MAG: TetR/AcrR family transcriptional regulator [Candidatus Alcyoniella australis]|nr:TetR/AcrR family transcriptional regulator [Candidatus Alcyoniella australis]